MTITGIIECSTCQNKIRLRYQVGYIDPVHVRIGCGGCGKVIKGVISQNGEGKFDFGSNKFMKGRGDFQQTSSISSELPIAASVNTSSMVTFSPYLAIAGQVGGSIELSKFVERFKKFQILYDEKFEELSILNDLLQSNSIHYFLEEAKKHFRHQLSLDLKSLNEYSFVANEVINDFFKFLETAFYSTTYRNPLIQALIEPNKRKRPELRNLRLQIEEYIDLEIEYKRGYDLLLKFLKNVKSFIPVIVLSLNNDFGSIYGDSMSITTFEFLELKELFIEQFEFLSRISSLYFGLVNLAERNDFNDFGAISGCSKLESYQKMDNGLKKEFVKKSELLSDYFLNTLNSQIRNGIGHLKTKYNPITQEIQYFPYKDKDKIDKHKSIYLIDFAYLTYQQTLKVRDALILLQNFFDAMT